MSPPSIKSQLVNSPEDAVDESLQGFVACHPHGNPRVLVRADVDRVRQSGNVTIVSGGGSGHEPVFSGYLGMGGLTSAAVGSIFASPPTSTVVNAIEAVQCAAGVLVVVLNYTGDRLNFGAAVEQCRRLCRVRMVVIEDDVAVESAVAGRRAIAGCALLVKMAGAMAEHGMGLDQIADAVELYAQRTTTIGVALSSCSPPGHAPLFELPIGRMEVGLGIHGEAGVVREVTMNVSKLVDKLLSMMVASPRWPTATTGDQHVLLVNNLGTSTAIEMNIVARDAIKWAVRRGLTIARVYNTTLVTSLDMHGFSLSLLLIDERGLRLLDAPSTAAAFGTGWSRTHGPIRLLDTLDVESRLTAGDQWTPCSTAVSWSHGEIMRACLVEMSNALVESEAWLNECDSVGGDGDCGSTMARGARALLARLDDVDTSRPANTLRQIAQIWSAATGGTTGAIYAIMLHAASSAIESRPADRSSWATALKDAIHAVSVYALSKTGDRTLLDALCACQASMECGEGVDKMSESTKAGASSTRTMKARAGRASYVPSDRLQSRDAGAEAVAVWVGAVCRVLGGANL